MAATHVIFSSHRKGGTSPSIIHESHTEAFRGPPCRNAYFIHLKIL